MNDKHEVMRQLQEMALSYGRKHKSEQTGYVHYCYNLQNSEPHLPIPVVENFLFALALLRSRTIENVSEAKTILEGLLHFQNRREEDPSFGNFPIYLHDFPACKDRFTGIQVAVSIYWILKLFHQVLGNDLNSRLEEALLYILKYSLNTHAEKAAPYELAIKIGAAAKAGGHFLQQKQIEEQGESLLNTLCDHPDAIAWYSPSALGSILIALKMVYPCLNNSPWKQFWTHINQTWHRPTLTYAGPALKEWQKGNEPQATLYDLYLGYFSGGLSGRTLKENPAHLEGVLITSCEDILQDVNYPLKLESAIGNAKWIMYQDKQMAYCLVEEGKIPLKPNYVNGFHTMRLIWGSPQRVHTFVCQGSNSKETKFSVSLEIIQLWFDFDGPVDIEDREKCRDIAFYVDSHPELNFKVAGEKSSTFRLNEPISISSKNLDITLNFQLEEGDGRFLGHRMLINRPSQIGAKGNHRYEAFDWSLFLRTLGRSEKCRIIATISINRRNSN